jgi:hypothetical protein
MECDRPLPVMEELRRMHCASHSGCRRRSNELSLKRERQPNFANKLEYARLVIGSSPAQEPKEAGGACRSFIYTLEAAHLGCGPFLGYQYGRPASRYLDFFWKLWIGI